MRKILVTLSLAFLTGILAMAQEEARLLRFPTIHGNQVVFSYAGDLYTVSSDGGTARKITTHEGYEMFPKFSPDGNTIAFTGQYDGNTEVFTIPAKGGEPKRLTYTATLNRDQVSDRMGPNNIVMAWTPDGKDIVFRTRKITFNSFVGQLFQISAEGGVSQQLPLPRGGFCSFSADGQKMAYNKIFREFRTWKYYQGGMADDIWIHDFKSHETIQVTDNDAQDIQPMWYKDRIYFLSDRDRTMNLFVYHIDTKKIEKVTNFDRYDIKFPSIGQNYIVFEKGGYLFKINLDTHQVTKLNIQIREDFLASRKEYVDASNQISAYEISPDGNRALFSARGDIYTVPANSGITYNLTASSGAHDRNPKWSPDGKHIAYLSDKSGEFEIYLQSPDGASEPIQITKNADTYKYGFSWSNDSKKIAWTDRKQRLRFIDIDTKKITEVFQSDISEIRSFDWSSDSKWIAYTQPTVNDMSVVKLYNLETAEAIDVTKGWYSSNNPKFSQDGKYLFFTSDRDFNPDYSYTEWNHSYQNMTNIYFVTLAKDTESPFGPKNDRVHIESEKSEKKDEEKEESKIIKIDVDGIQNRLLELPLSPSYYFGLTSINDKLYYMNYSDEGIAFKVFDLTKNKETDLKYKGSFEISADGKKMLIKKNGKYGIISTPTSAIKMDKPLDLSEMKVWIDKKEEWNQIYAESWRQMRDFFYVENMHGVDWNDMKGKYQQMVPFVNNRHDLNYLIGELIGELNVGHAYVNGGDLPAPKRIKMGLLGADISADKSGYFKIDKILKGENFRNNYRSPFTEVGVNVNEGDYILEVNGVSTKNLDNIYKALIDKANKIVEITVNSKPKMEGSHKELIKPIADESDLYYYNWVEENIRKVSEATDGQVGYIHVPDMGVHGLNEFVKYFYPQLHKKGLIIDDRGNGGGNVSPMIIERLRRQITRTNMGRNSKVPSHTPTKMHRGPKVLLINEYSASDGDLFPYSFKKHNLGTVIGVRTWGGIVGIRGSLPFIDGADLRKPEFTSYSADESKYIIEGRGVKPHIEVVNDPYKEFTGTDEQLNKAIEVVLEQLKDYEELPQIPADPNKSK